MRDSHRHHILARSLQLAVVLLTLVCGSASVASAQVVSSPTEGLYRPGRYMPLRIETASAGLVRVRGADVQGIDWAAGGASSVVVPLMIYRETLGELELTVNDKPVRLPRRPIDARAAWPGPVAEIDPPLPGEPRLGAFTDAAYIPAGRWKGGRAESGRRYAVYGAVAVVLVFGAVLMLPTPRARAIVAVGASVALCALIAAVASPRPDRLSTLVARGNVVDRFLYLRTLTPLAHRLEWGDGVRVLARSPDHLAAIAPVLTCDAAGRPIAIDLQLPANEPVAVLRLGTPGSAPGAVQEEGERAVSTDLARQLYGRAPTQTSASDGVMRIDATSRP